MNGRNPSEKDKSRSSAEGPESFPTAGQAAGLEGGHSSAPEPSGAELDQSESGHDKESSAPLHEEDVALSVVAEEPADSARSAKSRDINSVDEFLRYAYGEGGKRLTAPKSIYVIIDRNLEPAIDGELPHALVLELSANDPLLAVPPRILVHADDADAPYRLRRRLADCMGDALRLHPAFRASELQRALDVTPDPEDVNDVFVVLRKAIDNITSLHPTAPGEKLKPSERARLRTNAVTALALVLASRDDWPVDRLVECLYRHLWTIDVTSAGSARQKAAIADSKTPEALAIVARAFDRRAKHIEGQFAELQDQHDQLFSRVFAADQELENRDQIIEQLRKEVLDLESKIADLGAVIEQERHGRMVDQSHHVDDYESLRTRIVRLLDSESKLLTDGLHALRNERPQIAEEFMARSLEAFGRAIQQMRDREALG